MRAVTYTVGQTDTLAELSDDYTYRVNMLLDEGREDLAVRLAAEYERETFALLAKQNSR
jgi:hypothetical protein